MKKLSSLAVALVFIIFTVSVPVFAEEDSSVLDEDKTMLGYYVSLSSNAVSYSEGNITFDEYMQNCNALHDEYAINFLETSEVQAIEYGYDLSIAIGAKIANSMVGVADSIAESLSEPYKTTEQVSNTDMQGYGAYAERWVGQSFESVIGKPYYYYYCDYIVIDQVNDGSTFAYFYSTDCNVIEYVYNYSDKAHRLHNLSSPSSCQVYDANGNYVGATAWKFYGDVRYGDGSPYPTDDEYGTISKYDFTQKTDPTNPDNKIPTTEDDLIKFLEDFLEELEISNPDLSDTEGLLKAIYYRLGKLDSDDDNALLSEIVSAINSLHTQNSDIADMLEELKKAVTGEDTDITLEDYRKKILAYLYPGEEDLTAAKEFSTNVQGLFYTKFAFIDEFKSFFSGLSWGGETDTFEIKFDNPFNGRKYTINFEAWDSFAEIVRYMLAFFIYGNFAVRTYKRMPGIIATGGSDE